MLRQLPSCTPLHPITDVEKLLGEYRVPESERERVNAIRKAIANFDYDEVPELLEGSGLLV